MNRAQRLRGTLVVSACLLVSSSAARGQTANASTAATGLSGAFTARAQGYNAVNWNPANLGMPGNPGFSMTLLAFDGQAGIKPIDLNKVALYSGDTSPKTVREQWMLDVETEGGQKGGVGGGITAFALSIGSLAFQVNTKVASDLNLAPGAVEAILFGNAGRTGTVKALDLAGSSFQSAVYTTGALAFGMPVSLVPLTNFALGATAKYTVGHFLAMGIDGGSAINTNDITVNFPTVAPDSVSLESGNIGSGVGLDLGASWTVPGGLRFGVSMQNVINTFKWDTTKLSARPATGLFNSDTNYFNSDSVKPYSTAPAALREKVAALKFKPVFAAGVAFDWIPRVTVSADVRQQVGDGIEVGPKSLIAAGAELRLIPFVPLRAGVQMMTGGFGVSGGVGLHLLGIELGVAGYVRKRDGGSESGATVNLLAIRP